jgi:O-antigen/teichoic acid export membrane protein
VWLFQDDIFNTMKPLFTIMMVGTLTNAIAIIIKAYFNTIAQYQYEIKAAFMAMVVNVVLTFIFVQYFQIQGLAMAYTLGYVLFLALMIYYYQKHTIVLKKSFISYQFVISYWRLVKNKI